MTLKITIALREVEENQEEVAFEEMMRRQYNMALFNTLLDNTERSTGYNTIQYDTISMATIAIKNDISRWGWWWGASAAGGSLSQRHCRNVIVATLWPSVTSQLFSSISSSPFYLLEIIFCYCLPGGNYHNVTVATLWPSMTSQLFSSISSFPTSIFLKSWSATVYQRVTVTTSLSRWWLCVTSQCI